MSSVESRKKPANSIYTRTGDEGFSSLYDGTRLAKSENYFQVLGRLDELNVWLGTACEYLKDNPKFSELHQQNREIQNKIFWIGANIATPRTSTNVTKVERTNFPESETIKLEEWIDEMQEVLPPLRNFILPGGGMTSLSFHQARCKCREAERSLVILKNDDQVEVDKSVLMFINRLSDYLFVCARMVAEEEVTYQHPVSITKK
jgi:cob(I)alamin adenosyltransferase